MASEQPKPGFGPISGGAFSGARHHRKVRDHVRPEATQQGLDALRRIGVLPDTVSEGAAENVDAAQLDDQEATIHFKDLGIVVAGGVSREKLEQIRAAAEAADNPVTAVRPEYTYKAI